MPTGKLSLSYPPLRTEDITTMTPNIMYRSAPTVRIWLRHLGNLKLTICLNCIYMDVSKTIKNYPSRTIYCRDYKGNPTNSQNCGLDTQIHALSHKDCPMFRPRSGRVIIDPRSTKVSNYLYWSKHHSEP